MRTLTITATITPRNGETRTVRTTSVLEISGGRVTGVIGAASF